LTPDHKKSSRESIWTEALGSLLWWANGAANFLSRRRLVNEGHLKMAQAVKLMSGR
jgi:hypothetical protein